MIFQKKALSSLFHTVQKHIFYILIAFKTTRGETILIYKVTMKATQAVLLAYTSEILKDLTQIMHVAL